MKLVCRQALEARLPQGSAPFLETQRRKLGSVAVSGHSASPTSALRTCSGVHKGLSRGSRGPHRRGGEAKPGVQPTENLHILEVAPGHLIPIPYRGHLPAGDAPSWLSWKTRRPFQREGLPDTGEGENT